MHFIENTTAGACVPLSAIAGGKIAWYIGEVTDLPNWAGSLLGPLGALAGTIIAIRWLLARLDKAETKADLRDKERDANLTLIAQMTMQNQTVISQNSVILSEVKDAIEKCVGPNHKNQ